MTTLKAIVRNGRLEVNGPIDLPEGTELLIPIPTVPSTLGVRDEDWSDTPESIDAWIRWLDSLEPLDFTTDERATWDAARNEQKTLELMEWETRSKQVEGLFP